MKKLEKTFTKKGFKYTQIKREGNFAIYQQDSLTEGAVTPSFEVVEIKSHDGYEIGGQKIAASEVYPSTSQWGNIGWTFRTIEDARAKFKKITK
jgi:hypothetical protein